MKKNKNVIIISILLILNLYCLYLIDIDEFEIFGLGMNDIVLIVDVIVGLFFLYKLKDKPNPPFKLKWFIISFLAMALLSSIVANIIYDQNFFIGFRGQRYILAALFLYFPIAKCIHCKIISKEEIIQSIRIVGIIQLVLFITQYLFSFKGVFLAVQTAKRYGNIRFYFNPILLDLLLFIELNTIIKKGFKIKEVYVNIIVVLLIIFEIVVVQKYRLTFIGLALTSFIVLMKAISNKKIKYGIIIFSVVGAISFILFTNMGTDLYKGIVTGNIFKSVPVTQRLEGKKYYLDKLKDSPILGTGYPNFEKSKEAYEYSGRDQKYYLTDNGIVAFAFMYGLVGLAWVGILWYIFLRYGYKAIKENIIYFAFPLFFVLTSINELHWYWNYGPVVFMLFIVLFEAEVLNLRGKYGK